MLTGWKVLLSIYFRGSCQKILQELRGTYRNIFPLNYFQGPVRAPLAHPRKSGSYQKGALTQIHIRGIIFGASQEFFVRTPERLPNKIVSEANMCGLANVMNRFI